MNSDHTDKNGSMYPIYQPPICFRFRTETILSSK